MSNLSFGIWFAVAILAPQKFQLRLRNYCMWDHTPPLGKCLNGVVTFCSSIFGHSSVMSFHHKLILPSARHSQLAFDQIMVQMSAECRCLRSAHFNLLSYPHFINVSSN
ncbi:hypothetical protein BDD12DRAFT_53512 [Trichophaea hybrida]|nr:hypothetical protein BDD12DRAFT_53512 [Trichophaea hybrida]